MGEAGGASFVVVVVDAEELFKMGDDEGVAVDNESWSECSVVDNSSAECTSAGECSVDSSGLGVDSLVSCSSSVGTADVRVLEGID